MKKFIIFLMFCMSLLSYALTGKVVKVADGDTITVLSGSEKVRVRLYGIDAPEKKQEYGIKSLDVLKKLVDGKVVDVQQVDKDQYGRVVGKVYLDGKEVNLYMLETGNAWYYKQYAKGETAYAEAEAQARNQKLGLWQKENPEAPWIFRKKQK